MNFVTRLRLEQPQINDYIFAQVIHHPFVRFIMSVSLRMLMIRHQIYMPWF